MFLAKRLVLAHFWVAFVAFVAAIVLGEWQMFVRSPLSAWVGDPEHYYRSVTAPRHGDGLRLSDAGGDGLRLCDHRARVEAPAARPALGMDRLLARHRRHGDGGNAGRARPGLGALHLLPADDRQRLLLPGRRAGGGRLVGVGGAHGHQPAGLEEGQRRQGRCRWRCSATWPARTCGPGPRWARPSRSSS